MDQQIIETLRKHGDVHLDDLVHRHQAAGWSSVFLAVDRLSRSGQIVLRPCGRGDYQLMLTDRR